MLELLKEAKSGAGVFLQELAGQMRTVVEASSFDSAWKVRKAMGKSWLRLPAITISKVPPSATGTLYGNLSP